MTAAGDWDQSHDLVIVGSGAGAVIAALRAREAGFAPRILEKTDAFGGSTAISGGVAWIPVNPVQQRAGVTDTPAMAAAYLEACAAMGGPTRGASPERRAAFLRHGPETIAWLEGKGMQLRHAEGYSDYHEGELPGGVARSRSLVAAPFDARRLGSRAALLRRNRMSKTGIPATADQLAPLSLNGRTWHSRMTFLKLAWYMARNRLGADYVGFGGAVQGRLLEIAFREGIDMRTNAGVDELVVDARGAVRGVVARIEGRPVRIEARRGVLLNAGGFGHNQTMREAYLPQPTSAGWTLSNPGETGEIIQAAQHAGAALEAMDLAWWVPGSILPDGLRMAHSSDVSKPFGIMVDANGERFVNESTSYVKIGIAMYERHKSAAAVPAWFVADSRNRARYRWGGLFPPGKPPQQWLDNGYIVSAPTLAELAGRIGVDPAGLARTVARFNGFARTGKDEDFGRGGSGYNRFFGDPTVKPNPNLGAIEQPPFYAIRIHPTDVGTSGGIVTDEHARALREDGTVIEGLYATGNCTSSVVGRSYPGAGASIGAAMVFGDLAARHACGVNR